MARQVHTIKTAVAKASDRKLEVRMKSRRGR